MLNIQTSHENWKTADGWDQTHHNFSGEQSTDNNKKCNFPHPSNQLSLLVHADVEACLGTPDANPTSKRVRLHDEFGWKSQAVTNKSGFCFSMNKKSFISLIRCSIHDFDNGSETMLYFDVLCIVTIYFCSFVLYIIRILRKQFTDSKGGQLQHEEAV